MVPCPWARDAAGGYRGEDVGVHLTLNAELETYRWGPITHSPSLLDGDGGFPRTVEDAWDHADLDEVRRECRAQIERAILWGFDVSHLDSHMGALQLRPEFFDIYLDMAVDFRLPIRLPAAASEQTLKILDGADPSAIPRYADILERNPLYQKEWIGPAKAHDEALDAKEREWLRRRKP